jgi:Tfp pilus assembly protein PilV
MKHSRSSLFLMEMIIAILFFSLASAVCIQLFTRSHLLSTQTVNQNHAVIQAQNLAESYLSLEGNVAAMQDLFSPSELTDENTLRLAFDSSWNLCADGDSTRFLAELHHTPAGENGIMEAVITVYDISAPESPVYTLSVMHHTAERRDSHA